jgi:ABC-type dipeptide/oligopeptide/nickel transport system permease component
VSVAALEFGSILGGTVIIEEIFAIPGLGRYFLASVLQQDLPAVQALVLVFVVMQILVWLAADIFYGYLDPKVRA